MDYEEALALCREEGDVFDVHLPAELRAHIKMMAANDDFTAFAELDNYMEEQCANYAPDQVARLTEENGDD